MKPWSLFRKLALVPLLVMALLVAFSPSMAIASAGGNHANSQQSPTISAVVPVSPATEIKLGQSAQAVVSGVSGQGYWTRWTAWQNWDGAADADGNPLNGNSVWAVSTVGFRDPGVPVLLGGTSSPWVTNGQPAKVVVQLMHTVKSGQYAEFLGYVVVDAAGN